MQESDAPTSTQGADPLPSPSAGENAGVRRVLIFLLKAVIVVPLAVAALWIEYQIAALLIDAALEKPYVLTGTELWWTRNAVWCLLILGPVFYINRCRFG